MKKLGIVFIIACFVLVIVLYKMHSNNKSQIDVTQDIDSNYKMQFIDNKEYVNDNWNEETKKYVKIDDNGNKRNMNENIMHDKNVNDLIIKNINLVFNGKDTEIECDVQSQTKIQENMKIKVSLIKDDGTEWISVDSFVSKTENAYVGKIKSKICDFDFTNANDIKFELK